MKGVLQLNKGEKLPPLPEGTVATVTLRVVGRNTKGALATATVPLDGVEFPAGFSVRRRDLREVPDYLWLEEDLYVRADEVTPKGASIAVGRAKAKAIKENDQPAHGVAYVTLDRA